MRGIPNHPVKCGKCGNDRGCPKDGLCHRCRITGRPNPNKRFVWTTELDILLHRAYSGARNRCELSDNLTHLHRRTGFTRVVILSRAEALGLSRGIRRRWTEPEIELLRENLGTLSKSRIAKRLGRTYSSVKAQVARMALSARVSSNYSQQDVGQLLGVGQKRVGHWIQNGWLRTLDGRVTETTLEKFLRHHPHEYQLSRVDEAWFKGMLFPNFTSPWLS